MYRVLAVLVLALGFGISGPAAAGEAAPERTTIAIVGDSLADGIWGGIYRTVHKDKRIKVFRGAKNSVGFTGSDLTDMVDRAFAAGEVNALVMMIGANDRRSFFVDGRAKALFGTPGWIDLYRGRVERFMDHAARRQVPLVWILLPVMRAPDATRDAALINTIVTDAAKSRPHVHLIETARLTSDEKGAYTAFFKDRNGVQRHMRAGDGVHFEMPAYELFADLVLQKLRTVTPTFAKLTSE